MSRQAIIERERRLRPWVIVACVVPLLLLVVSATFQPQTGGVGSLVTESLRTIDDQSESLLISSILGSMAFTLLALPLFYVYRAAAARTDRMLGGLVILTVVGPLLFALQGVLLAVGRIDVADQFVVQEEGVGDVYSLARNLLESSSLTDAALAGGLIALPSMIFAMVYTCLWGFRTGLLTRFHGTLGMALGASLIIQPLIQITFPALMAWFMYLGLMLWGRTRSGRHPAWDAGEAKPWPGPGQEPEPEAGSGRADVVAGDATEIPGLEDVGRSERNAARRERAKKRKRKRRR